MLFAHDTDVALATATTLINTFEPPDTLTTVEELDAFVEVQGFTGSRTHDEAELDDVRDVRHRLWTIWTAPRDDLVEGVNALLRDAAALPQLVRHDDWDWHVHATTPDAPLATRMAVEAAMALVDVIRADETERLRTCADDDCGHVLVDLSRNRSRRYCEAGCGNRANVAAYRARKATAD